MSVFAEKLIVPVGNVHSVNSAVMQYFKAQSIQTKTLLKDSLAVGEMVKDLAIVKTKAKEQYQRNPRSPFSITALELTTLAAEVQVLETEFVIHRNRGLTVVGGLDSFFYALCTLILPVMEDHGANPHAVSMVQNFIDMVLGEHNNSVLFLIPSDHLVTLDTEKERSVRMMNIVRWLKDDRFMIIHADENGEPMVPVCLDNCYFHIRQTYENAA